MMQFKDARLCIIGVGPGDPDLVTLKAVRLIGMADVVAYPTTANGQSRARRTVQEYLTPSHEELPFHLPMSVDPAPAQQVYDDVSDKLRGYLAAGRSVALLCEGDPFFYGSAIHIYRRLANEFATSVVPGITSLTAAAAMAGVPLASREETIKVLPATMNGQRLRDELAACDTAVIIKVGRHFEKVARALDEAGLRDNALLVEAATQDEQRVVALGYIAADTQAYFSMMIVQRGRRAT